MSGLVHIPLQKDAAEMDTMDIGVAVTDIFPVNMLSCEFFSGK